jgi:uncharacterized membrane protein
MRWCRSSLTLAVTVVAAVALLAAWPAAAQTPPTATDLGVPEGYGSSEAVAVNASGLIGGYAYNEAYDDEWGWYPTATLACVWEPDGSGVYQAPTPLPLLVGYTDSIAQFINDSGQIVGWCDYGVYNLPQACMWTYDDGAGEWTVTGLGFLQEGADNSWPYGMNAAGQVVGWSSNRENGDSGKGFIWDSTNGMQAFTGLADGPAATSDNLEPATYPAHPISDTGVVVGEARHGCCEGTGGVIWDSATKTTLGIFATGQDTLDQVEPLAISPSGLLVAGDDQRVFPYLNMLLWTWNADTGAFDETDLGHPTFTPTTEGDALVSSVVYPTQIDDSGQILGVAFGDFDTDGDESPDYEIAVTWLWSNGAYTDLSTTLPEGVDITADLWAYRANSGGPVILDAAAAEYSSIRAFLWSGTGTAQELAGLGGNLTVAEGINDAGVVVGQSALDEDTVRPVHACVWTTTAPTSSLTISEVAATRRNSRTITVTLQIGNPSTDNAMNVTVTAANLGGTDTTTTLPLLFGKIKPGASKKCTLQFKNVPAGDATLTVHGTSSLGDFFTTQTVAVP